MKKKKYRLWVVIRKVKTKNVYHTTDLVKTMKFIDNQFDWSYVRVYCKKTNEVLGEYQNQKGKKTMPVNGQEL